MSDDPFLSRWSRLKKASAKAAPGGDVAPKADARPVAPAAVPASPSVHAPADAGREAAPLPPVESLTPESDFSPFMGAKVEESLKRRALKTLFQDPRFNVMDGLDVYIDDYSKPDPLPDGWLEKMSQMARLGDHQEPAPQEVAGAAEGAPASAVAELPGEVRNSVSNEPPAIPAELPPSDTSEGGDDIPPVQESQIKPNRLT